MGIIFSFGEAVINVINIANSDKQEVMNHNFSFEYAVRECDVGVSAHSWYTFKELKGAEGSEIDKDDSTNDVRYVPHAFYL